MVRIIFFLGCLLQFHVCFCQQKALNSLLPELEAHPKKDTIRLNLLNELAYAYSSINPEKGLVMADSTIFPGREINDKKKLASAYSNKGVNYWALGNDSLAARFFKEALGVHYPIKMK